MNIFSMENLSYCSKSAPQNSSKWKVSRRRKEKENLGPKLLKLNFKKILSHLKSVPSNLKKRETSRYKQLTSSFGPKMFYCGIFEMKLENYCHILNQENASIWYL